MAFRATSTWAVLFGRHSGFAVLFLHLSESHSRHNARWSLGLATQISCTKYDICILDGIHRVFAATSVIIWPCRMFCSFEAFFMMVFLVSGGGRLLWPTLFLSSGVLILRASCAGAKRRWCHFMYVNCSQRVFARLLFDW